jgi:transposase
MRETVETRAITPIIPIRKGREIQVSVGDHICVLRNRIERCFKKLKKSRRLATRYEKTAASYLGFGQISSIRLWTRIFVNRS